MPQTRSWTSRSPASASEDDQGSKRNETARDALTAGVSSAYYVAAGVLLASAVAAGLLLRRARAADAEAPAPAETAGKVVAG